MMHVLLSVVIPCYNYAEVLPRAIASVLRQLSDDSELLVINDGSSDHTDAVVQDLLVTYDKKFRYIKQSNVGLAATRNHGVKETSGRYVIFLDADDELLNGAITLFRQSLQGQGEIGMLAAAHISRESDGREKQHFVGELPELPLLKLRAYLLDKTLSFSNGAVAINRQVLVKYPYPERFRSSEDVSVFSAILANEKVVVVSDPVLRLHKHSDSLRHNILHAESVGMALVEQVFNPININASLQVLKMPFSAQRALSLFRTFYLAGDMKKSRVYFSRAVMLRPAVLFKFTYLRKYILSWFK